MPAITDPTSRLIAARIRRIRTETMGWTLSDLAKQMPEGGPQLSGALLGRIENCTRAASVPEVHAIAAAMGATPGHLMSPGTVCETCGQETTR